jgi:hypothetical protein
MVMYVIGYGIGRFWIEGLRIDAADELGGLRWNQWMALAAVVGGVIVLGIMRVRQDSPVPIIPPANVDAVAPDVEHDEVDLDEVDLDEVEVPEADLDEVEAVAVDLGEADRDVDPDEVEAVEVEAVEVDDDLPMADDPSVEPPNRDG